MEDRLDDWDIDTAVSVPHPNKQQSGVRKKPEIVSSNISSPDRRSRYGYALHLLDSMSDECLERAICLLDDMIDNGY